MLVSSSGWIGSRSHHAEFEVTRLGCPLPFRKKPRSPPATPATSTPCRLEGCFRAYPPGSHFIKPTRLSIRIGKPVTFEDCPDNRAGWNTVAKRLHQCIEDLSR
jgi:hypothetical protein